MNDLLEHAYSELRPNSLLHDTWLSITDIENGLDISQWPPLVMIADDVLKKEAERHSFGRSGK